MTLKGVKTAPSIVNFSWWRFDYTFVALIE